MSLPFAFLQNMSWVEIAIIIAVIMFLFGAKKIPDIARSLGRSSGEFKRGLKEGNDAAAEKAEEIKKNLAGSDTTTKE